VTFRPFGALRGAPSPVEGRPASLAEGKGVVAPASVPAVIAVIWLVGAVVTWNMVFDAHIVQGARDYVDRQQLFIDGRGPHQDMEQVMAAARSSGARAASFWAGAEILPGAAICGWFVLRNRRGRPASRPAASR
jgi:hypothetical protein